jgi:hypothetical protein
MSIRILSPEQQRRTDLLKSSHIHFMVPCYGAQVSTQTFISFMRFATTALQNGIQFTVDTMTNESLIPRGRNNLIAKAMANPLATHFMFVDADIGFEPEAPLQLVLHDLDVVTGLYPMKGLPIRYNLNIVEGARRFGPLYEVATAATGFMMIKRSVMENLFKLFPEKKYFDSIGYGKEYEPFMYAIFESMVDEHGYYLSEDWTFCKLVREKLLKPIWADTTIKLDHIGQYNYQGNLDTLGKLVETWTTNDKQTAAYEQVEHRPLAGIS